MSRAKATAAVLSDRIRRIVIEQSKRANVGHIGSSLSVADILGTLYSGVLRGDGAGDPERDRMVLSKGHASLALYAALHETGVIDGDELASFCVDGSRLGTHPDHVLPGVDFSTGSLGHGLSLATGSALAARLSGSVRRTFVLMSDAECNEGSVWEAVMFAAHHRFGDLVVIVDVNGQQALGYTHEVLDLSPLEERWSAFGWDVHTLDGHDHAALRSTIDSLAWGDSKPHVLLAQTIFGHGVSYMEREISWHYLPMDDGPVRGRPGRAVGRRVAPGGGGMRKAFVAALAELADSDPRVLLLTGDLGFMAVEPFAERHPDRFINVGVAEQNMVGMATGLAEAGYVPFVYSIATFAALRSYEFIRNGPVLHDLPVRIVGVGPGLDYGPNGITHWALEDVAVLRPLPGLTVIAPADDPQTAGAVRATAALTGPAYLRLARLGPAIAGLDGRFAVGRAQVLGDGGDVALVALGNMASTAVETQALLAAEGVAARVVIVSCVRPAPTHDLVQALADVPLALSIESHYVDGGVGSLTAEIVAENGLGTRLVRAGVRRSPSGETGSAEFLHARHGLAAGALARAVLDQFARRPLPLRRSA